MKKFVKELKEYMFFGELTGIIIDKKDCVIRTLLVPPHVHQSYVYITLAKKVHFLGKNRLIYKEVLMDKNSVAKFSIGDYYSLERQLADD